MTRKKTEQEPQPSELTPEQQELIDALIAAPDPQPEPPKPHECR